MDYLMQRIVEYLKILLFLFLLYVIKCYQLPTEIFLVYFKIPTPVSHIVDEL